MYESGEQEEKSNVKEYVMCLRNVIHGVRNYNQKSSNRSVTYHPDSYRYSSWKNGFLMHQTLHVTRTRFSLTSVHTCQGDSRATCRKAARRNLPEREEISCSAIFRLLRRLLVT
ncbi:hypothetical protein TNCV_793981 [Trichonephila clavipes]|nr:hypothetical protein TNCV_793981 [Trichonephila clavipes]